MKHAGFDKVADGVRPLLGLPQVVFAKANAGSRKVACLVGRLRSDVCGAVYY